jgi:hypothetical protein
MDRISALRNVEDAMADFEDGDLSLPELEREVRGILRTYATDFEGGKTAYRAVGEAPADGLVVLADSEADARDRIDELVGGEVRFDVEPVED